jgi:hypothetical protein
MASRALTDGEIALAKTVFGDALDYKAIKVHDSKFIGFHPEGTAMAPNGNLYMYGCYHADYSKLAADGGQSLFIHEMTHVWQHQNKVLNPMVEAVKLNFRHKFNYGAAYAYALDAKKDLLEYNMEQQASIVEDYFVLRTEGRPSRYAHAANKDGEAKLRALYEAVLKNFLADPAYGRKAAQDKKAAARSLGKKPRKPPGA